MFWWVCGWERGGGRVDLGDSILNNWWWVQFLRRTEGVDSPYKGILWLSAISNFLTVINCKRWVAIPHPQPKEYNHLIQLLSNTTTWHSNGRTFQIPNFCGGSSAAKVLPQKFCRRSSAAKVLPPKILKLEMKVLRSGIRKDEPQSI
jgi:hypothetical protein